MSRTVFTTAGAALAAGVVGAALLTSNVAGAATHPRVEHFHAHATSQLPTGATSFVLAEQDVAGSTVIGHDVLYCQATRSHSTCSLAFATRGGLIYARLRIRDADHTLHGTVTGGAERYAHAHGTISGQLLSPTDVSITLRYQV